MWRSALGLLMWGVIQLRVGCDCGVQPMPRSLDAGTDAGPGGGSAGGAAGGAAGGGTAGSGSAGGGTAGGSPAGGGSASPWLDAGEYTLVQLALGPRADRANSVVVQPDGRIVVAGSTQTVTDVDALAVRFHPDGGLDPSFGSGGIVQLDFNGGDDSAAGLALQPDGRVLLGGSATISGTERFMVLRLSPLGALDPTFGDGGIALGGAGAARALALQPDGRVLLTGGAVGPVHTERYLSTGALDPAFGDAGQVITAVQTVANGQGLALLGDGRIYVAGGSANSGLTPRCFVLRYLPNGARDPTFGVNGLTLGPGTFSNGPMVALPDGRLLVTGADTLISRRLDDGGLDPSFAGGGQVSSGAGFSAGSMLLVNGDDILLGGTGLAQATFTELTSDGGLKAGFGDGGVLRLPHLGTVYALANDPGGGVVFAGAINDAGSIDSDLVVGRIGP